MLRYFVLCLPADTSTAPHRVLATWYTLWCARRHTRQERDLNPNREVWLWDAQEREWIT